MNRSESKTINAEQSLNIKQTTIKKKSKQTKTVDNYCRKEKSLGALSQRFTQYFTQLSANNKKIEIKLEDAAKQLGTF